MPWIMEVNIERPTDDGGRVREWQAVRPTGGSRYEYATRHEAESMLRTCYPEQTRDEARTREV